MVDITKEKHIRRKIMKNKKTRNRIFLIILIVMELFFILLAPRLWGAEIAYEAWGGSHVFMACVLLLIQYVDKRKDN